jgi:hypothetical protein
MSYSRCLLICAGGVALAGCNTVYNNIASEDPYLGEAVKYNAAVQTVNPDPVYPAGSAQPGENGDKGAHAVKRYRTDAVKETQTYSTGGVSGSGPH